ncbi:MAG: dihydrolipoyl dehydrogenase [Clostridia bacterium]
MSFDLIVIGGGPGGYVAAIRGAQLGAKVALVEKDNVGGTCLNWGCIPTKALVASAEVLHTVRHAADFGIQAENCNFDFSAIMARKDSIVKQLTGGVGMRLKKTGVEVFAGEAKVIAKGTVEVTMQDGSKQSITGKNIIVATGSEAATIAALGYNGKTVVTSKEALSFTEVPKKLLVIGGGVIGCEFAMVFAAMGSEVTVVEMMPTILPMVDLELVRRFVPIFKKAGIAVKAGVKIEKVETTATGVQATLDTGDVIIADNALISIGRTFNSKGLGLEELGLVFGQRGEIAVNDFCETNIPGIYAIGDVTNKIQLAHFASAQGILTVENIIKNEKNAMRYDLCPSAIFTSPEIAFVGLTEQQAKDQGIEVKTGKFPFSASGKAVCMNETDGLVKIVVDAATDKILGVHILGPHATDLIAEATLAITKGETAEGLAKIIHAHPTLAETMMEAAEAVHGMSIHFG